GRRWTGLHGLILQVALDVSSQAAGRLIAPSAVFLERLHHDPVELTANLPAQRPWLHATPGGHPAQGLFRLGEPSTGLRRLLLPDQPQHLVERAPPHTVPGEWSRTGQELVEQHAEAVDVRARVDVRGVEFSLLGAHVLRRAQDQAQAG